MLFEYPRGVPDGTIVNCVEDTLAAVLAIRTASTDEILWLIPPSLLALSLDYDILEKAKQFIHGGGTIRGITTVTQANLATIRTELDIGEAVRHTDSLSSELFMYIGDRHHSLSAINIGINEYTLDTPIVCYRSHSPVYVEYLLAVFENAWSQAVPAEERIQELLNQSPRYVNEE